MPFPPSAACRFFDLPPVNLQNLPLHLTKNSFASAPTHLCGIALSDNSLRPGGDVPLTSFTDELTDSVITYWSLSNGIIWYEVHKQPHWNAAPVLSDARESSTSKVYSFHPIWIGAAGGAFVGVTLFSKLNMSQPQLAY